MPAGDDTEPVAARREVILGWLTGALRRLEVRHVAGIAEADTRTAADELLTAIWPLIEPDRSDRVWAVGENDHGGMTYCLHATEEAARECLTRTRLHAADDVWPVDVFAGADHG